MHRQWLAGIRHADFLNKRLRVCEKAVDDTQGQQ